MAVFQAAPVQAAPQSNLLVVGSPATQVGTSVTSCGIRKDMTLYANIANLPTATPALDQPIAYLRYRFQDKSGHFLLDQFVPWPSQSADDTVYFGRDTLAQLGKLSCDVAAMGSDMYMDKINAGNELRACQEQHGRAHVDFGLDYHLRSLAFGKDWVAILFDGYMNTFFDPESPHTMQDARFFTRLDHAAPVDVLLNGDNSVASVMYPNIGSGPHLLDFGADDSLGQPENFWRICFDLSHGT
jgi:hypothetical protein